MKLGLAHQLAFIDRMIFNFLIGNADAHAKNSAILYKDGKAGLAPIYDVMSTVIYPALSKVNAMSIGGAHEMSAVSRESFISMVKEVGISSSLVVSRLDSLARRIVPADALLFREIQDRPRRRAQRLGRSVLGIGCAVRKASCGASGVAGASAAPLCLRFIGVFCYNTRR